MVTRSVDSGAAAERRASGGPKNRFKVFHFASIRMWGVGLLVAVRGAFETLMYSRRAVLRPYETGLWAATRAVPMGSLGQARSGRRGVWVGVCMGLE